MKKILIVLTATLLFTVTANGQNLFFIGGNSYPCTETMTLTANSDDANNLNVLLAKDGNIGLFAVSSESNWGAIFSNEIIIYLQDGAVIKCNHRESSDYVDNRAKAAYALTSEQLSKLRNSNIHTVRYTLEVVSAESSFQGMKWNWSASNRGIPTKTIITEFLDGKISGTTEYREEAAGTNQHEIGRQRKAGEAERLRKEAETAKITQINNQAANAFGSGSGGSGNGVNYSTSKSTGQGVTFPAGNSGNYGNGGTSNGSQGSGTSFSLAGRKAVFLPKPNYPGNEEGIVVVSITVNKNGKVIAAKAGVQGTTTNDSSLFDAARQAALKATFNADPNASALQSGTITYRFVLD